jgi:hypothetical protein
MNSTRSKQLLAFVTVLLGWLFAVAMAGGPSTKCRRICFGLLKSRGRPSQPVSENRGVYMGRQDDSVRLRKN